MEELKLYYFTTCPFCKKVLKFIDKNKLNDQIIYKNIHEDLEAKIELKEEGGKEQVPCLFINDEPLYESNNILNWLKKNKLT